MQDPLPKAILLSLSQAWPEGLSFEDLVREVFARLAATPGVPPLGDDTSRHIALFLLEPLRHRFVRLTPRVIRPRSPRPDAPRLEDAAREQADRYGQLTGPYHDVLQLDEVDRLLVARFDGRPLAELGRQLAVEAREGELTFVDEGVPWPTDELLSFLEERLPVLLTRLHHLGVLA